MFKGSVPAAVLSVLAEMSERWQGLPIYIGGSGNFTIERALCGRGFAAHGCDVSLYSCLLGRHLSGQIAAAQVADPACEWVSPYLEPGLPTLASIMLVGTMLQYYGREEPYHRRMWTAYFSRFEQLHGETMGRIARALDGVRLASFYEGDLVDFIADAPEESVVISYPPTYSGGYERLYERLHQVFGWQPPPYVMFDEARRTVLLQAMQEKRFWVFGTDARVPELDDNGNLRAIIQAGARSRPLITYAGGGTARLALRWQKTEPVPWPRAHGDICGPLRIAPVTAGQINTLRALYLNKGIAPVNPSWSLAVLSGDELIGALGFAMEKFGGMGAYMLSDFAVRPTVYKRLAKLVAAASLSVEVKTFLEQAMARRVYTLCTTAFTERAVSMKYRGLYEPVGVKDGMVNYEARAGRWTLEEAFRWWQTNHSQKWNG